MPFCDGCYAQVDDSHIRRRIERLELATRFRPIHIQVLLIDATPPARFEDYFYRVSKDRAARSPAARAYFDELARCAGTTPGPDLDEESALAEFQRRGFYLIGAIECPQEDPAESASAIERAAPILLRRIQVSYKPKSLVLLSQLTQGLVPMFQANGWAGRLILDDGRPFADPLSNGRLSLALSGTADA